MIENEPYDAKRETQYEQNDEDRKKLREISYDAQADLPQGIPNPTEKHQNVTSRYRQLRRHGQHRPRYNQQREDEMRQPNTVPYKLESLQRREQLQIAEADCLHRITVVNEPVEQTSLRPTQPDECGRPCQQDGGSCKRSLAPRAEIQGR